MNQEQIWREQQLLKEREAEDLQTQAIQKLAIAIFEVAQQLSVRNSLEAKRFNP